MDKSATSNKKDAWRHISYLNRATPIFASKSKFALLSRQSDSRFSLAVHISPSNHPTRTSNSRNFKQTNHGHILAWRSSSVDKNDKRTSRKRSLKNNIRSLRNALTDDALQEQDIQIGDGYQNNVRTSNVWADLETIIDNYNNRQNTRQIRMKHSGKGRYYRNNSSKTSKEQEHKRHSENLMKSNVQYCKQINKLIHKDDDNFTELHAETSSTSPSSSSLPDLSNFKSTQPARSSVAECSLCRDFEKSLRALLNPTARIVQDNKSTQANLSQNRPTANVSLQTILPLSNNNKAVQTLLVKKLDKEKMKLKTSMAVQVCVLSDNDVSKLDKCTEITNTLADLMPLKNGSSLSNINNGSENIDSNHTAVFVHKFQNTSRSSSEKTVQILVSRRSLASSTESKLMMFSSDKFQTSPTMRRNSYSFAKPLTMSKTVKSSLESQTAKKKAAEGNRRMQAKVYQPITRGRTLNRIIETVLPGVAVKKYNKKNSISKNTR